MNQSGSARTIPIYFSTQELYIGTAIDKYIDVASTSIDLFSTQFTNAVDAGFFAFLCFQLAVLLFFRRKLLQIMKDDIFLSRGILNLIPDTFFEVNRAEAERLI